MTHLPHCRSCRAGRLRAGAWIWLRSWCWHRHRTGWAAWWHPHWGTQSS